MDLRAFQRPFVKAVSDPNIDIAALSCPRGNGKSTLTAMLVARSLTPGDELFEPAAENVLTAASFQQARIVFRVARALLGEEGFRYEDSNQSIKILHKASRTTLRVHGANSRTALGILGARLVISDEPGAHGENHGTAMWDTLRTSLGKQRMSIILIGTLSPARPGNWWPKLIEAGSGGGVHVTHIAGSAERWSQWQNLRKCNPLTAVNPLLRRTLLRERDKARSDSHLLSAFKSYRINVPSGDVATVLLDLPTYKAVCRRPVAPPDGRPIVGIDQGCGRAFSAAVAVWPTGRTEAIAVAPGIPSIQDQETRDSVPRGTYKDLVSSGQLVVDEGRRVQRVGVLVDYVLAAWQPLFIVADRVRYPELLDSVSGRVRVSPRVTRWSEAAFDIRALRRMCLDGPMSVDHASRKLLGASLAVTTVRNDDAGNMRIQKTTDNAARDDASAAWVLAAGAISRLRPATKSKVMLCG